MDTLRWILLIVGLLVIAGLFGYYKWEERRASRPRRKASHLHKTSKKKGAARDDRDVEAALQDMDDFLLDDEAEGAPDLDPGLASLEVDPDDEPWTHNPTPASHYGFDDPDSNVGPVRVRRVDVDDEQRAEEPRPAAGFAEPPGDDAHREGWRQHDAVEDQPERVQAAEPEETGEAAEADRLENEQDEEKGQTWGVGPVRIRRPAWARETSSRDGGPEQKQRAVDAPGDDDDRVAETVGEKIIVLHIHAGEGLCFTAPAVKEALDNVGLRFGQHGIYHRHVETRRGEEPVYSVASMVKPGTLDPNDPDTLETPGLAMFLRLPGPFDGLSAFEQMLETARRLADQLDGHLLDSTRCNLTAQAVEHIREDLREYRRLAHLAARKSRA
ncbi:cell division protein ZipA [Aquisalimonas sp.]|uniref:cell division protein ZipA n=1 Tax=Aquisalimonas sp. TaxID=1872621 RepID=UPI0025C62355|nr:cell division protein ZipA [Aquisalimonas sp.]